MVRRASVFQSRHGWCPEAFPRHGWDWEPEGGRLDARLHLDGRCYCQTWNARVICLLASCFLLLEQQDERMESFSQNGIIGRNSPPIYVMAFRSTKVTVEVFYLPCW